MVSPFKRVAFADSPLRISDYVALFLTFAFAATSGSLGANADAKAKATAHEVQAAAPAGVTVNIDTNDIFTAGIIFTSFSFSVTVITAFYFACHLSIPLATSRTALRLQAIFLAFTITFVMASLIPFDDFVANRSAIVTAAIGTLQLSPALVAQLQQEAGISSVYWQQSYLHAPAIVPWFEVLFGYLTVVLFFRASSRADPAPARFRFRSRSKRGRPRHGGPASDAATAGTAPTANAESVDGDGDGSVAKEEMKEEAPVMEEKNAEEMV